jgi:hypothetical protein
MLESGRAGPWRFARLLHVPGSFPPRLETLAAAQRRLLRELASVPSRFVLYGGTALVLRRAHRVSEDFDYFANARVVPDDLEREIALLAGAERLQAAANTLVSLVDRGGPVKLSFFGGLRLRRVRDPEVAEDLGIQVASLLDLAATKVSVVQSRAEAKDYRDVAELMTAGVGLAEALAAARAVYGAEFNPLLSLKALSFFGDGDLPTLPQGIREALLEAVRGVDLSRLPPVEPMPGGISP